MSAPNNVSSAAVGSFDIAMSLYIPRVDTRQIPGKRNNPNFETTASDFISLNFELHKIGDVQRVDLIKKKNNQGFDYFIAFIHFKEWFRTAEAYRLQENIRTGKKAVINVTKDHYWIVKENKNLLNEFDSKLQKELYKDAKANGQEELAISYLRWLKENNIEFTEDILRTIKQQDDYLVDFLYMGEQDLAKLHAPEPAPTPVLAPPPAPVLAPAPAPDLYNQTELLYQLTPIDELISEQGYMTPQNTANDISEPTTPIKLTRTISRYWVVTPKDLFGSKENSEMYG